jgi:hypothetical protein
MVRVLAIVAMIILLGLASTSGADTARDKWNDVCTILDVDCTDIAPPIVVTTNMMGAFRLHGAYFPGENYIFVDPDSPEHTIVHEMTHYLLYEMNLFRNDRCGSEYMARRVHHAWEGTEYDDTWRAQYRCPPL